MQPRPLSVTITSVLIVLSSIIWLILGIMLALNAHPGFPDDPLIRAWMAALSIAAACILFMLVIYLEKRRPPGLLWNARGAWPQPPLSSSLIKWAWWTSWFLSST